MCVKHIIFLKIIKFYDILKNIQWSLHYNLVHTYFIKLDNEKIGFGTILINQFQMYFYYTNFFQILYWNYHKHNGTHNGFIIK